MIANKAVCKIKQSLTFLLYQFIEAVHVTIVAKVFLFLLITYSWQLLFHNTVNVISTILFK